MYKTILIFVFAIFLYNCYAFNFEGVLDRGASRYLKVDRLIGKCRAHPKAPITIDQVKINNGKSGVTLGMRIKVTEDVGSDLKVQFMLQRCQSHELINTCEKIPPIELQDFCAFIESETSYWSPLLKSLEPQIKCPIVKGHYATSSGTLDASGIKMLPIDGHYWKVEIKVLNKANDKVVLCINTDGQVMKG